MRRLTLFFGVVIALLSTTLAPSAQAITTTSICVAYDIGGPGDHSFNDAVAAGIITAKKRSAIVVDATVTIGSDADRELRIRSLVKKGCDLVIVVGSAYAPAVKIVATEYADHQFAIVNDASVDLLNVASLVFAEDQGGYLAGVAAALVSKKAKIGLIGNSSQSSDYESGFIAGARATKKKIAIVTKYGEDSWGALAETMIASGVDVIFLTTAGSGSEVFNVVVGANKNGKKVGLIGVEPDQYVTLAASARKYILASVVKRVDRAVVNVIGEAVAGRSLTDLLDPVLGICGHRYGITGGGIEFSLWSGTVAKFSKAINTAAQKAAKLSTLG
ncbi:MAG: BMP family ABC transporter substrate-binding protein [Actinomycetota bacterium]